MRNVGVAALHTNGSHPAAFDAGSPRALVFAEYFPPYMGSDRRLFDLMTNLPDWNVTFAVVPPLRALIGGKAEEALIARFELHERPWKTSKPHAEHRLCAHYLRLSRSLQWLWSTGILPVAYAYSIPGFVAQSVRLIRQLKPDLVVAGHPSYLCGLSAVLAARICGVPVLLDYPDAWTPLAVDTAALHPSSPTARILRALESFIARRADRITAITRELADYVRTDMKVRAPIAIVGNGGDDTVFAVDTPPASRGEFNIPADHEIVVYSGRLEAWSGTEALIQTIKLVVAQRPRTTFLILGDGNSAKRLREAIASEELANNAVFLGYRRPAEMPSLIALADLAVIPFPRTRTTNVCAPIKLYEYMLMNKPIVTTDLSGVRESVSEEQVHFISDVQPARLSGAIVRLLSDPEYRAKLAQHGYFLAKRRFTWQLLGAQFAREMTQTVSARLPSDRAPKVAALDRQLELVPQSLPVEPSLVEAKRH